MGKLKSFILFIIGQFYDSMADGFVTLIKTENPPEETRKERCQRKELHIHWD